MKNDTPILELKGIKKHYSGVTALNGVSISFNKGEIHGIVGENGAGKSTLIKIVAGVTRADDGKIFFNNNYVKISSGRDAHRLGFSFIHQELNLIPYLNCMENIFLGHNYPKNAFNLISWKKLKEKTKAILKILNINIPLDIPVNKLSPGNQAMIAIARAFATTASIYFMDEPTASLTNDEKEKLFSIIRSLKTRGMTVIYVTHRLKEIVDITDRVTVLRGGEVVGTWDTNSLAEEDIIQYMIGRKVSKKIGQRSSPKGEVVLSVKNLYADGISDINFDLHQGEILGIAGLVGSGRTRLLRIIYGIEHIKAGSIFFKGKRFRPRSPGDSIKHGIVYLPEERRSQGLILNMSIMNNISLVYLKHFSSGPFINRDLEIRETTQAGKSVNLQAVSLRHPVKTLSGGNQQKVVFAKYLIRKPIVLMLDEPTRGVDVATRFEIYTLIRKMSQEGMAVLLVSSDLNEFLQLTDRFIVLHEGTQKAIINNSGLNEETLLMYCYGRGIPEKRGVENETQ